MTQDTPLSNGRNRDHTLADHLASAVAWWKEAGVDHDFADAPAAWLAQEAEGPREPAQPAAVRATVAPEPAAPQIAPDRTNWPGRIEDFAAWWLAEPTLGDGETACRVPPRGPANADLMILVAEPEAADTERLLSGPQGRFLANFIAAAGVPGERIYFASILPRHTPLADWDGLARSGIAEVTCHHIGLVAPARLLTFGRTVSSLLGHDPAQSSDFKLDINHGAGKVSALACWDLAALLMRAKARSGFWQRWLDWTVSNA